MKRVIRAATGNSALDSVLADIEKYAQSVDYDMILKGKNPLYLIFKDSYDDGPEIHADVTDFTDDDGTPGQLFMPIVRFPSYEFGENDDGNPGYLRGQLEDWAERVGGLVEYITELKLPK